MPACFHPSALSMSTRVRACVSERCGDIFVPCVHRYLHTLLWGCLLRCWHPGNVIMPYIVMAFVVMACVVMAYVVMACIVIAYVVMAYSYGLCLRCCLLRA